MAYYLGVDIGTTYAAAAVWRDGRVEVANLGNRAPTIPSVVFLREDEGILTGEAAERRGLTEPRRVAREFKRRIGDPTPIIVGGTPYSADALMAKLLRWVVDRVSETEGGPPAGVAISYPANWGSYKHDLLRQAIAMADLDDVATLSEPEAAAIHYASQERVESGSIIAVFDLGGGTFDAAVLRKEDDGWSILGEPQGIERLGGVDFDEAVFQHVVSLTDGAVDELDPDDTAPAAAMTRLRQECVAAKEALSSDTEVSIPVLLPNLHTEVRLTRSEFEHMVRPSLADSITALRRGLRSAGVEADQVTAVLLVGGSSRIPLVAQLVSSEVGRPIAVDAHPKHGIALGAAIVAAERADAGSAETTQVEDALDETIPSSTVVAPASPPPVEPSGRSDGRQAPVRLLIGIGAVVMVIVLAVAVLALRGDGDGQVATGGGNDPTSTFATGGGNDPTSIFATGGGNDPTSTFATGGGNDPTSTIAGGATISPTTDPPVDPTGPFVRLDGVVLDGGSYRTRHTVFGYTPEFGGRGSLHIHFFLNTTEPANAGTNGQPPGDWEISDEPLTYLTAYAPGNRGSATQLCAVVATFDHEVFDPESGTCIDLPS